ncbi:MAG: UDP-3-O-(3-hydroxymyristoyl)glucosamine N-acyltransferase [Casimicrobium sp.]
MGRALRSPTTAGALAEMLGIELRGDANVVITSVASLTYAAEGDVTFFSDKRHAAAFAKSHASAVIAPADAPVPPRCAHLVHPQPHAGFAALLSQQFHESPNMSGRSALSSVHSTATINDAYAADFVGVGARSSIGFRTQLHAHVQIGRDVVIGDDCVIYPNVTIYDGVRIGNRCVIHAGTVIGSDGFGFQPTPTGWMKVPQVGAVVIGDDVEIGSNTSIDRGAIEDTVIGNGVKIDNLVQIAHNVRIGEHTAIAGCAGIAGSATIGKRCMIGGAAMVIGHLEICDDVIISGGTLVSESVREKGRYTAVFPWTTHREWMRIAANLRRSAKSPTKKPDSTES